MAITSAVCSSFKQEVLVGTHNFTATSGNSFKLALYTSSATFGTATVTARGCMIYNDTNSDKAVCAIDFGGDKTSTAGDFTVVFPSPTATGAIIRLA
jgi:hypothetical protein